MAGRAQAPYRDGHGRATSRRSRSVAGFGSQTSGRKLAPRSEASTSASILSVLIWAFAMAFQVAEQGAIGPVEGGQHREAGQVLGRRDRHSPRCWINAGPLLN